MSKNKHICAECRSYILGRKVFVAGETYDYDCYISVVKTENRHQEKIAEYEKNRLSDMR